MAYKCSICGKSPHSGNSFSHSHKASKRVFNPNLQKQKVMLKGVPQSVYVCTDCIRSGRVTRPSCK